MRRNHIGLILVVALLGLPVWGALSLLRLRFASGDIYPPYSSLRADPQGARALYESLEELGGVRVARRMRSLARLEGGEQSSLLLLGLEADQLHVLEPAEVDGLDRFARSGGRVVLALEPPSFGGVMAGAAPGTVGTNAPPRGGAGRQRRGGGQGKVGGSGVEDAKQLAACWGIDWERNGVQDTNVPPVAVRADGAAAGLPGTLPRERHVTLRVAAGRSDAGGDPGAAEASPWRWVYQAGEPPQAVVVERRLGRGTVVVCAESALFSNHALWARREPAFLHWVVGDVRQVVFDEGHLGVLEEPGVGTLGRRYRLQGVLAGLLVLAAAWVWHRTLPLVPLAEGPGGGKGDPVVEGRDSISGLTSLLKRHVPAGDVLQACLREWRRSCAPAGSAMASRAEAMEVVAVREASQPLREQDPVRAYREMAACLERSGKGPGAWGLRGGGSRGGAE